MKYIFIITTFLSLNLCAQSFITDQFLFGGTGNDEPIKIVESQNKLYLLCRGGSFTNTGNLTYSDPGCSGTNTLLICLDENGNSLWQKVYCGNSSDSPSDFVDVGDGFVIAMASHSQSQTGNKTSPLFTNANQTFPYTDYWLVKVDYEGNIIWQKTYGSDQSDWPLTLSAQGDNLLVVGYSDRNDAGFDGNVSGNKTVANKGRTDTWLLLLDENGDELWQKTLGVVSPDNPLISSHGGVILPNNRILISQTTSLQGISGDKTVESFGVANAWLVCLDMNGNQLWDKVYGGEGGESNAKFVVSENHVYYIMQSNSGVAGNRTTATKGTEDILVYKLDFDGNIINQTNFGTDGFNEIYTAYLHDNRIILSLIPGVNEISIDKSEPGRGGLDAWFLSFDAETLELVNEKTYGGPTNDHPRSVVFHDNSLFITAHTGGTTGGDKTVENFGIADAWFLSFDAETLELVNEKTYGGLGNDSPRSVVFHNNSLYIANGTASGIGGDKTVDNFGFVNAWLLKVNPTHLLTINDQVLLGSQVYPNPATNQINISFSEPTKLSKAVLYDLSGKVVREQDLSSSFEANYVVNTKGLASGVYSIRLVGDGFSQTRKVVVE